MDQRGHLVAETHSRYGWTRCENTLLGDKDLSDGAVRTYLMLRSYCYGSKTIAWPGQDRLAADLNRSRSSVYRHLKELHDSGWSEIRERKGTSHQYVLKLKDGGNMSLSAQERLDHWTNSDVKPEGGHNCTGGQVKSEQAPSSNMTNETDVVKQTTEATDQQDDSVVNDNGYRSNLPLSTLLDLDERNPWAGSETPSMEFEMLCKDMGGFQRIKKRIQRLTEDRVFPSGQGSRWRYLRKILQTDDQEAGVVKVVEQPKQIAYRCDDCSTEFKDTQLPLGWRQLGATFICPDCYAHYNSNPPTEQLAKLRAIIGGQQIEN